MNHNKEIQIQEKHQLVGPDKKVLYTGNESECSIYRNGLHVKRMMTMNQYRYALCFGEKPLKWFVDRNMATDYKHDIELTKQKTK